MLRRSTARHGKATAIACGEVEWSYAEFDNVVDRLSAGLALRGVEQGDRVAICARNSHAFMAVRFAVARLAAILVPVNFMLKAEEVRYVLEHSGARVLFLDATTIDVGLEAAAGCVEAIYGLPGEKCPAPDAERAPNWEALLIEAPRRSEIADQADIAQIIYTSGTESRPKGAALSHGAILWQYQSCIVDCEWTSETVALHTMPLFHCAQLDAMIGPALSVGAKNIITAHPSAENIIGLLDRYKISSFFAPPTIWIALLRSPLIEQRDFSHLTKGYYGASIMPVEVIRELRRRLPKLRLWNLYGQTEIAPVATILFPEEHAQRLGSAGRATLHVETRVVDENMCDAAVGEVGEIVHRSPQLMTTYWNDPQRTAEAFAGGWFHSGDLAVADTDGYLTIVDRKKDMIKTGGENVSSREVEEAIYRCPEVREVAVVGLPDPKWVEAVTAFVVRRDGSSCDEETIINHCSTHLAVFKVPRRVIFLQTLPKNASGKILKRDLRLLAYTPSLEDTSLSRSAEFNSAINSNDPDYDNRHR